MSPPTTHRPSQPKGGHANPASPDGPSAAWLKQQLQASAWEVQPADLHTLRHNALAAWHRQQAQAIPVARPVLAPVGLHAPHPTRERPGLTGLSLLLLGGALLLGMWLAAQNLLPAADPLLELQHPDVLSQMGLNEL